MMICGIWKIVLDFVNKQSDLIVEVTEINK